jgi:hypothetical protein
LKFILTFIALVVLATPISTHTATADSSYLTYDQLKAYTEKQAEQQWSAQLVAYAQTLVGKRTGTCVLSLRNHFGVPRADVQGLAKSTKINSKTGKVGAVIVFRNLSKYGHVGYIIADHGDTWLYFHSNIDWRGTGRIDKIAKTDSRISGYRLINYK